MRPGDEVELQMVRKRQDASPDWGLFAPAARTSDPMTSKLGEKDMRPRRGTQAMRLLVAYNHVDPSLAGLTDEQAATAAGLNNGAWKRCSDLRRAGFIEPTGLMGLSSFGSAVQICRITPRGVHALEEAV